MKISEQWLREWVNPPLKSQALADCLTLGGLTVDALSPVAADLKQVVVGMIEDIKPHPQADKLRVCRVHVGKGQRLDIVCGASNAAAGMRVPVALVGSVLPNGTAIAQTQIRGVSSAGMLCSAAELGLEETSDGLLVLDADARPGQPLSNYLKLQDNQIELDLTPNRADCLSIAGVARELAALTARPLTAPKIKNPAAKSRRSLKLSIQAKQDCPHYVGRVIEAINPKAITPLWMRERLRRAGMRSIHPVVDVTNYVMLEWGQPMHAFDLDKIAGGIQVRHAKKGETITLLDGNRLSLTAGALVIADAKQALALAGIMGGEQSAVSSATTDLFLESAWFRPQAIGGRARGLGLHTESSHRFERGVDPQLQVLALQRASELLMEIVGGRPGPLIERSAAAHLPKRRPINLRHARISRLLGVSIPAKEVASSLKRLGFQVKTAAGGWRVTPPSWRFDIERECDLIEEVVRLYGYEKVPTRRPQITMTAAPLPEARLTPTRLRDILIDRDYQEAITYSFIDPQWQAWLDPHTPPITLANPISADMAVMRTCLWPGLLKAAVYNHNRQMARVRLFEIGRRFLPEASKAREEQVIGGLVSGSTLAEQWGASDRKVDFFDLKGDVEALLAATGNGDFYFETSQHPALHPGQAAEIRLKAAKAGQPIGYLGALHPEIQAKVGLDTPVFLFELHLEGLLGAKIPHFQDISKYPAIRRDLAIVVAESTPASKVCDCVIRSAGKWLVNLELFDEYRGEGIDSGRKSLALGLTLQDSSRTLREEDVEGLITQVVAVLGSELGAELRQ